MARIDVRYPRYCPYTVTQNADGTEEETYGIGKVAGKAMAVDPSVTADSVIQYADGGAAEASAPFTGGTLKVELNDLIDTTEAELCGHTISADGILTANTNDEPPYVLFGFVYPAIINGAKKYGVRCYKRVKFAPPSDSFKTRGKSLDYQGVTISGALMQNKNDDWKVQKACNTMAEAMGYLNTWLHMPSTHTALTVTSVPIADATAVAVTANVVLTFNNPIDHGNATLVNALTNVPVASSKTFDGSKLVLTIDPTMSLTAATAYAVILTGMTDAYGQTLEDTAIKFTTA